MKLTISRKRTVIVAGLIGIVLMSVFVMALSESEDLNRLKQENGVRLVKAQMLSTPPAFITRSFPGVIKAANESKLAFRVGGPLISLDVNIGQKVKKDDVLAQIDPRDYEVNVQRLKAALQEASAGLKAMQKGARPEDIALLESQLNAANTQLHEANLNLTRIKELFKQQFASKSNLDRVKTAYDIAQSRAVAAEKSLEKAKKGARVEDIEAMKARIKGIRANLTAAENALEDTRLKAPFEGFINEKFVENFETVKPGESILSLLDFRQAETTVAIPDDMVIMKNAFKRYYCRLPMQPKTNIIAKLKEIGLNASEAHQSYPLTITMDIPENIQIRPGMAVEVFIEIALEDKHQHQTMLPVASLFSDASGKSCIWKIDRKNMTIQKCTITQGEIVGNQVRIESGLKDNDLIVTAGARFLRDGQKVRIMQ